MRLRLAIFFSFVFTQGLVAAEESEKWVFNQEQMSYSESSELKALGNLRSGMFTEDVRDKEIKLQKPRVLPKIPNEESKKAREVRCVGYVEHYVVRVEREMNHMKDNPANYAVLSKGEKKLVVKVKVDNADDVLIADASISENGQGTNFVETHPAALPDPKALGLSRPASSEPEKPRSVSQGGGNNGFAFKTTKLVPKLITKEESDRGKGIPKGGMAFEAIEEKMQEASVIVASPLELSSFLAKIESISHSADFSDDSLSLIRAVVAQIIESRYKQDEWRPSAIGETNLMKLHQLKEFLQAEVESRSNAAGLSAGQEGESSGVSRLLPAGLPVLLVGAAAIPTMVGSDGAAAILPPQSFGRGASGQGQGPSVRPMRPGDGDGEEKALDELRRQAVSSGGGSGGKKSLNQKAFSQVPKKMDGSIADNSGIQGNSAVKTSIAAILAMGSVGALAGDYHKNSKNGAIDYVKNNKVKVGVLSSTFVLSAGYVVKALFGRR